MMTTPAGMSRRHFMSHMAGAAALTVPALTLTNTLRANAADLTDQPDRRAAEAEHAIDRLRERFGSEAVVVR